MRACFAGTSPVSFLAVFPVQRSSQSDISNQENKPGSEYLLGFDISDAVNSFSRVVSGSSTCASYIHGTTQ